MAFVCGWWWSRAVLLSLFALSVCGFTRCILFIPLFIIGTLLLVCLLPGTVSIHIVHDTMERMSIGFERCLLAWGFRYFLFVPQLWCRIPLTEEAIICSPSNTAGCVYW